MRLARTSSPGAPASVRERSRRDVGRSSRANTSAASRSWRRGGGEAHDLVQRGPTRVTAAAVADFRRNCRFQQITALPLLNNPRPCARGRAVLQDARGLRIAAIGIVRAFSPALSRRALAHRSEARAEEAAPIRKASSSRSSATQLEVPRFRVETYPARRAYVERGARALLAKIAQRTVGYCSSSIVTRSAKPEACDTARDRSANRSLPRFIEVSRGQREPT